LQGFAHLQGDGPAFALPPLAVAASRAIATESGLPSQPLRGTLVADPRGAVTAEYAILLGVVGVVVAAAIAGLGPPLVEEYARSQAIILAPYP
jgi:Flp pilus assembly pilin Flp